MTLYRLARVTMSRLAQVAFQEIAALETRIAANYCCVVWVTNYVIKYTTKMQENWLFKLDSTLCEVESFWPERFRSLLFLLFLLHPLLLPLSLLLVFLLALQSLVERSLFSFRSFSTQHKFFGVGFSAPHSTWRTRVSLFVWVIITFHLSGMGYATSSDATASIALRVIWPRKPQHYVKVGVL